MIPVPYILIGAVLSGFWGGWQVNQWYDSHKRQIADQAASKALQAAAEEIAKIEVSNVTIKQKVERVVQEKLVYTECKHDANSLLLINEALSEPTGNSKLSTTNSNDK